MRMELLVIIFISSNYIVHGSPQDRSIERDDKEGDGQDILKQILGGQGFSSNIEKVLCRTGISPTDLLNTLCLTGPPDIRNHLCGNKISPDTIKVLCEKGLSAAIQQTLSEGGLPPDILNSAFNGKFGVGVDGQNNVGNDPTTTIKPNTDSNKENKSGGNGNMAGIPLLVFGIGVLGGIGFRFFGLV